MSNRKERFGWYIFDWAISAFSTTVITVFMGPYLTTIAENAAIDGKLEILGLQINPGSYFGYVISLSVLFQVLILPLIGAYTDKTNKKKSILMFFSTIGAVATSLLFFLEGNNFHYGGFLLFASNLAFGASMVVYNSFLNDISKESERDKVSSIGWGVGFLGGGVLLLLNLILYSNFDNYGITEGEAVRISLSSAGIWWLLFSFVTFKYLRNDIKYISYKNENQISSLKQLIKTLKELKKEKKAFRFLIAYLFYNDGVQAVITFSALFGAKELGLEQGTLITAILMVQFVAFFGSVIFNKATNRYSTKNIILFSLVIWTLSLLYAFQFLYTATDFYILAFVIALVLGGTQALSRSLFSTLIPKEKETEYFSFYEISERGTSWIGYFLFSFALDISDSYRIAILSLILLFIIGGYLLNRTELE
ncbi:MAG: MFS transporter [Chlorobiota bacterium]